MSPQEIAAKECKDTDKVECVYECEEDVSTEIVTGKRTKDTIGTLRLYLQQ